MTIYHFCHVLICTKSLTPRTTWSIPQRMTSHLHLMLRISRIKQPKHLTIFYHLNHTSATNITPQVPHPNAHSPTSSLNSTQDQAKIIATQLSNCTNLVELNQIYAHIIRTRMLDLYTDPFHWNNIIRSYTRLNSPSKALCIYIAMSRAGVMPDSYTFPIVLKAISQAFHAELGGQIHSRAIKNCLDSSEFTESGFISLYAKAGEFDNARKVFEQNLHRKLGSWNAMIGGLSQGGRAKEAIGMFMELKKSGFEPDGVTMVSVTSACGSLGDLDLALQLHKCVFQAKNMEKSDILMLNSLIDMYGKCGRMDLAYRVFSRMIQQNVSSWTSMIVGYAMHGHVNDAFECFRCMREAGVRPNLVTFVGVLSACVHGGTVQDGRYYFNMMKNDYGMIPKLQHYGCMVDLLGRAGLLEEAREMVERMPMKPNIVIWGCLMGACEKYENVKMGEWVAKNLQELEPWNDGVYVVLSNIYAANGLWDEVEKIRGIMKNIRLAKIPGYSLATRSD
ncbi:pentatricopeptide repeat-containing protein At1g77170, mitochondrial [Cornus florida]|uniref:pentatricopeptide repeat-containing protein At1g77170, mitochondrial n=1 Tax=Cornus florida TaxID=4283 RepID=UPI002896C39C|nr:pentatricopeptide repeat-containing protein At1g77170, mitochondrial [Cornus florida]